MNSLLMSLAVAVQTAADCAADHPLPLSKMKKQQSSRAHPRLGEGLDGCCLWKYI